MCPVAVRITQVVPPQILVTRSCCYSLANPDVSVIRLLSWQLHVVIVDVLSSMVFTCTVGTLWRWSSAWPPRCVRHESLDIRWCNYEKDIQAVYS